MEKRVQGRPSRAAGVVGRAKIVEDIRSVLRTDRTIKFARKDLAQAIGVTPALISYYFPDKKDLNEALCLPTIQSHREALAEIANRSDAADRKLRDAIAVLSNLYGRDRCLYDMYREIEYKHPSEYHETSKMTRILSTLFDSGNDAAMSFEAVVLQGAVCRMCELAAQINQDAAVTREPTMAIPTPAWFDSICSLFAGSRSMPTSLALA